MRLVMPSSSQSCEQPGHTKSACNHTRANTNTSTSTPPPAPGRASRVLGYPLPPVALNHVHTKQSISVHHAGSTAPCRQYRTMQAVPHHAGSTAPCRQYRMRGHAAHQASPRTRAAIMTRASSANAHARIPISRSCLGGKDPIPRCASNPYV